MALEAFLTNQNGIYAKIRGASGAVAQDGIRPEQHLMQRRGVFSIALMHSFDVSGKLSAISRKIAETVPAVAYQPEEIHTTLATCSRATGFVYDPKNLVHQETLRTLCAVAQEVMRAFPPEQVKVMFDEYLLTPEAVIAAGVPNEAFVDLMERIVQGTRLLGLSLESSWGAHVTISRFKKEVNSEGTAELRELVCNMAPPGESISPGIAAGYTIWGPSPAHPHLSGDDIQGQFGAFRHYRWQ